MERMRNIIAKVCPFFIFLLPLDNVTNTTLFSGRLDFNGFYTERLEKMAIERTQKASA